ncbi:MAG: DUF3857 domain-containing protein [Verrucomicrobia bacterium]|nr:DUF3857 domain-containing protein [Verrucomicrobiota bacterium]
MKKWILLLIFALSAQLLPAMDSGNADWRQAASLTTPTRYPDADVVLIDDINRIQYEADGTHRYSGEVLFKILTEKGRQEKSSISMGFDAAYGSLRILHAEIIKSDGEIVEIDLEKQTRETISAGQMSANIYDPNSKTLTLNVPDLKIGDVLHYTYAGERTKTVVPDCWSDWFTLEESDPIVHGVYEVDAPANRPLVHIAFRDEIPGTVTFQTSEKNGRILYRWEVRDVPQMFEEPMMPAPHTVVQRILLSTLSDWESLSKWYWKLSQPRLETKTPEMAAKVTELTEGITDRQKQIEAIFRFVSQDIRYMGITVEDEAPGYEPHDVSLTFNNRYGVCRDKAALLVAMLRLGGFDAYPVLIYVGPKKDPDVPQPWFNHAITAVRNEDGTYQLMDSTNENTRDLLPAYLSDCSYLVAHPDGETLHTSPVIPAEDNLLSIEIDATLEDQNRITGEAVLSFGGINDTAYRGRLARLKPDEREPYFEERLKQALGNATLTRLEIRPAEVRDTAVPLSITLRFELENALVSGAEESLLKVPTLINRFGLFGALLGDGIGLDKRRYPLKTGITCGVAETVRLDLRKTSLRPSVLPQYETVDNPELFVSRSVEGTNGVLISRADLMLRTVEFTPEQYLDLKESLGTAERNARKCVVLAPGGFPLAADLAILDETVEYSVYDEHNWKKEQTLRRKVLTYAGKNELSDLKITYNPAFELTVLNEAKITSPDGTVQQIDPEKEINLMDAPWAGDAPRYPAEKIMVASLPGVEIGSIIETKTTTLCRNRPLFSAAESFAGHNPIVKKTVRLRMPHKLKVAIGNGAPGTIRRHTRHDGELVVHEWFIANREMIKKEDQLPPQWVLAPTLFLSTGTMEDYAKTLKKALLKAAGEDKLVQIKARELTRGKSRLEKMTILRDFVDRTIRAAGPGLSSLPLSAITPADRILAEGYGNTTDRAVLLYALCKAAKLDPRFVLTSSLPRAEEMALPVMATFQSDPFNTLLVAMNDGKNIYYFGDSGQYAEQGTLAHSRRPSINLENGRLEIPQSDLTDSVETGYTIDLAENGHVDLIQKTVFSGTEFETFHKTFAEFTPEERRRETQNLLSRISQSAEAAGELRTSFAYPGKMEFAARADAYAIRQDDHLYLTLPGGLGDLLDLKSSQRENPFHIENPVRKTVAYAITLPDGWRPVLAPEPFRIELPNGAGVVEVGVGTMPGKLLIAQHAELNPALIRAEDYEQLLELNNRLTEPAARTLLLRKQ